jgi:DNA-directed RNA polymerase subunit beta
MDMNTGLVMFEAGHELSVEDIKKLVDLGVTEMPLLGIDHLNIGPICS